MIYYLLALSVVCLYVVCLVIVGKMNAGRVRIVYLRLCFLACALVLGLRDVSVGIDTIGYKDWFDIVAATDFEIIFSDWTFGHLEVGYAMFMKLVSYFGDYYLFQFVSSCLICYLSYLFIERNVENPIVGIALFLGLGLYVWAFNVSRLVLAVCFLLTAWDCLVDGDTVLCIVMFGLAVSVHFTSVVFGFVVPLYCFSNSLIFIRICPLVILMVFSVWEPILINILNFLPKYTSYIGNSGRELSVNLILVPWITLVLISLYYVYVFNGKESKLRLYGIFFLMFLCANFIGMRFNWIERLGYFYGMFAVPLYDKFGGTISSVILRKVYYIGLVVGYLVFFLRMSQDYSLEYAFFF